VRRRRPRGLRWTTDGPRALGAAALLVLVLVPLLLPPFAGAADPPSCAGCGRAITGDYVEAMGRSWHPECFVCSACGQPIGAREYFENEGKPYCSSCYADLFCPRCAICGQPLTQAYLKSFWGDVYCKRHADELPACSSCGRLISAALTGGGVEYEDGRRMCMLCRRTAVDKSEDAEALLGEVRQTLALFGMDVSGVDLPVRLVGEAELRKDRDLTGNTSTAEYSHHGRVVRREIEEITILWGLPRDHCGSVIAHELGHVWLFLQDFPDLPPLVEEGFCELSAFLWLQQRDRPEAEYRIRVMKENEDPVYGQGFRLALESFRRYTIPDLARYLREHREFPAE
jgi:hypothetical protein